MVDATDLKSVVRKGVRVRVPPSAPLSFGAIQLRHRTWMDYAKAGYGSLHRPYPPLPQNDSEGLSCWPSETRTGSSVTLQKPRNPAKMPVLIDWLSI